MVRSRVGLERVVPWVGALGAIALVAAALGRLLAPGTPGFGTLAAAGVLGVAGWILFDADRLPAAAAARRGEAAVRAWPAAPPVLLAALGAAVLGADVDRAWDVTRHGDHGPTPELAAALATLRAADVDLSAIEATAWRRGHGDSVDALHEAELDRLLTALRVGAPAIRTLRRDVTDEPGAPAGSLVVARGAEHVVLRAPDMHELAGALRTLSGAPGGSATPTEQPVGPPLEADSTLARRAALVLPAAAWAGGLLLWVRRRGRRPGAHPRR